VQCIHSVYVLYAVYKLYIHNVYTVYTQCIRSIYAVYYRVYVVYTKFILLIYTVYTQCISNVYARQSWMPCSDSGLKSRCKHGCSSVSCCLLSGSGLCDELITHSEEYYRVNVCV